MRAPSLTHSFRKTPRGSCFNSDWTDLWSRWEFALKTCPFLFIIFYQRFDKKRQKIRRNGFPDSPELRARLRGYDQQDDQFGALRFIHLHFFLIHMPNHVFSCFPFGCDDVCKQTCSLLFTFRHLRHFSRRHDRVAL